MRDKLQLLLFLLQLEEYDQQRVNLWLKQHSLDDLKPEKKKLVWTFKAKAVSILAKLFLFFGLSSDRAVFLSLDLLYIPDVFLKFVIILLATIKLRLCKNLIVIGITGSYGKTSVKEILSQVLSSKLAPSAVEGYQVLKTPESYNTPLSIAKIILQELRHEHQVLIVEMGAYKKGDIKNICAFVKPKIGILTAIGKQHLERFGSLENIKIAKAELLQSLPKNGLAILNGDNPYCLEIAKKLTIKIILYSFAKFPKPTTNNQRLTTITALNMQTTPNGSSFQIKIDGGVVNFQTKLLGNHNISNILAAAAVARHLEISWENIQKAVTSLSPIPHRLELINGANDTTIIDDAYNANPDSVKAALDVLKNINAPRKIVITPGLVELGNDQEKENEIMGKEIAEVADYLIIVGKTNNKALKRGFLSSAIKEKYIFESSNLTAATTRLQEIVIPKSVILFENDLPDQYL